MGDPGDHEVEARFVVKDREFVLRPALGRLNRVLIVITPPRLNGARGDGVNLGRGKEF